LYVGCRRASRPELDFLRMWLTKVQGKGYPLTSLISLNFFVMLECNINYMYFVQLCIMREYCLHVGEILHMNIAYGKEKYYYYVNVAYG
jgi:hypothetical protein